MKILVIEDEVNLAETLAEILKRGYFTVDVCYNGKIGWEYIQSQDYDGIVLDIMLPQMDGYEILKMMRKNQISTPVLVLTARTEMEDIVNGLDSGADDYMVKPFAVSEFLARVRAVTRRKENIIPDNLIVGNLMLSKKGYALVSNENTINLGKKEYQIMEILMCNPGQIISKEMLIEKIWGFDSDCEYNNIEVYISFLRKKLKVIDTNVMISNSRGIGYYLEVRND
jgi:DNA-binding response OmpR family regulator